MNKKLIVVISIFVFIILVLFILKFFGIGIGSKCGYYNFAAPYTESCDCVGVITGHCGLIMSFSGASCDGSRSKCLGIRTECFRNYIINETRVVIPCKD